MLLLVTYDLQRGADVDAFSTWSYEIDRPACLALAACQRFDVHTVLSADADSVSSVVELIEVTSLDDWEAAISAPSHAHLMETWRTFADTDSLVLKICVPLRG